MVVKTADSTEKKPRINKNLISLKCVLFIFFGGLGCIYPFLPLHMVATGLNYEESRIVSIVAPLVSLLGPLVAGILADRMAGGKNSGSGRYLRVMIALAMIFAAIFYAILLAVPPCQRWEARRPLVSFACDSKGAEIFQERCSEERSCYHWDEAKVGSLILTNCSYTCQKPSQFEKLYNPWTHGAPQALTESLSSEADYDNYDDGANYEGTLAERLRRNVHVEQVFVEPPHLCLGKTPEGEITDTTICHVYTEDTKSISIQTTLHSATNKENETHSAEWCRYPLDGFSCHIPPAQATYMKLYKNTTKCKPMVECEVHDPYDNPGSVLAESQCIKVIGNPSETFWMYLIIRSVADIFPTAAIALLNAAIVIATRETSSGRGDFGRQMAWGSLGWAIFAPIMGAIGHPADIPIYFIPFIVFVSLMVLAALVILLATAMPLSPPEWWWHTKSGMLAIPMSAIRKYAPETGALLFVTIVLGIFWSAIDSYQAWHIIELAGEGITGSDLLVGLTLTVGALPAIPVLWNAEKIVDFCGHSNILIGAFSVYILRYTGLAILDEPWWTLLMEAMEPVTLGLSWATIVMYMRHLMPRRLTATAQALPVIAYFCLGKSFGALLGLVKSGNTLASLQCVYRGMAIAAAIIAVVYFCLYHCLLAPRCAAKTQPPPDTTVQSGANGAGNTSPNTNGSYTPLRVYHQGRGRKGHFRY
ncbi:uncharacterized protein LOC129795946 [Lutzomyia longipalpis]|uniref:uncharacterized protein LOC129795946 n=1 Tax=Lutzomyia longipalpis TaxID=7200 RepID=UPI002483D102|nr:uncharacterized protein LOC129795946 [Lutzomyia longipalpis]XP_055693494.1 uncharacterized protein LOC129795946 [Lutzomyia longipalpis]XP_055693495.1 uncharacterized protein LOC129795946 [Lutzomyia longipalpis]XP_055693496.1 uncharacterized protein LOC129795946 [Lutzomyia longipalpis]XP_055693497.1 uncharacterized protein LOC129795946 [Lutzomyia longipalpis]